MAGAHVTFGAWMPLDALEPAAIPDQPGMLQVRAPQVMAYPRGKSAMILYVATPARTTLRAFAAAGAAGQLDRARTVGGVWVRFAVAADPASALRVLLGRFIERFGAPPVANAAAPGHSDPV